jgi:hypothetical protein
MNTKNPFRHLVSHYHAKTIQWAISWEVLKPIRWKLTDLVQYVIPRRFTCSNKGCRTKFWVLDRAVVYPYCPSCRHWWAEDKKAEAHYQHN